MKSGLELGWLKIKKKMGMLTDREFLDAVNTRRRKALDALPYSAREDVETVERLSNHMLQLQSMGDWQSYFKTGHEMSEKIQDILKKHGSELDKNTHQKMSWIVGLDENLGYRPAGARANGFMLGPFQPFTFFYENHWAVKSVVDCVQTEVTHDGFSLVYGKKVSAKRLREVKDTIDRLNIWELRLDLLKDYLVYGNALLLPHTDTFGNLIRIEKFNMDRVSPIWNRSVDELKGWDYWQGNKMIPYMKDRLLHLRDKSLKMPDIGLPPLNCLMIDLESDLGASSLNNQAMWKAGMIGILISLESDKTGQEIAGTPFRQRLQEEIISSFSGVKAGNSMLVANYVKNVHHLNKLSEFDGAFLKLREKVAIQIATVLKVPPESINLNRSSSLQYAAASLEDKVGAGFDRAISSYMTKIDKFINDMILKKLCGIYDVEIQANGRYGSMNLNSARAGLIASQTWGLFDVNETRTIFYGAPPCAYDDERGREIVDNSKGPGPLEKRGQLRFSKENPAVATGSRSMTSNYTYGRRFRDAA